MNFEMWKEKPEGVNLIARRFHHIFNMLGHIFEKDVLI
jgi:hypothetical protein